MSASRRVSRGGGAPREGRGGGAFAPRYRLARDIPSSVMCRARTYAVLPTVTSDGFYGTTSESESCGSEMYEICF